MLILQQQDIGGHPRQLEAVSKVKGKNAKTIWWVWKQPELQVPTRLILLLFFFRFVRADEDRSKVKVQKLVRKLLQVARSLGRYVLCRWNELEAGNFKDLLSSTGILRELKRSQAVWRRISAMSYQIRIFAMELVPGTNYFVVFLYIRCRRSRVWRREQQTSSRNHRNLFKTWKKCTAATVESHQNHRQFIPKLLAALPMVKSERIKHRGYVWKAVESTFVNTCA